MVQGEIIPQVWLSLLSVYNLFLDLGTFLGFIREMNLDLTGELLAVNLI